MSATDESAVPANDSMNLRTYAAIHLRVPASGIPELDAMIRQARRQEMVGLALQGILAHPGSGGAKPDVWADAATQVADAAIKAMEEKP